VKGGWKRRLSAWPASRWVWVMLVAYFAIAITGTWINFVSLHLNAIGTYDLSVNQQSLSSTVHGGKPYPFYEATNCGRNDRCSYLLVHPVLLAYPVAGIYSLSPSAFTLFAVQDAALALASLPLFAIARRLMSSDRWALIAAGVYLTWMPAFSGIFSFHWEAFIPLEIFTFFWLWLTRRYLWAVPVAIVAFVTLEITPVLTFFIGLFFLLPAIESGIRLLRTRTTGAPTSNGSEGPGVAVLVRRGVTALRNDRRIQASLGLLVGSGVAYILLHEFVRQGGGLLGLPPLPSKYSLSLVQPVYAANFTWANFVFQWPYKLLFWLVMFGTLALVPFLAPRTLLISAPWIAFSSLATSSLYRMGNQYAFISAAVLMIGFVYGLARLKTWMEAPRGARPRGAGLVEWRPPSAATVPSAPKSSPPEPSRAIEIAGPVARPSPAVWTETAADREGPRPGAMVTEASATAPSARFRRTARRHLRRSRIVIVGVVVVGILAVNGFLNPLNPYAAQFKTERPFSSQASLALGAPIDTTAYNQVQRLIGLMGPHAIVAVAPELFPLVANDRYAYPLLGGFNASYLPFNALTGTQFVLLTAHGGALPMNLSSELYNSSLWSVRGWVTTTYLGPILLFQRGYVGPIETLGPPLVFPDVTYAVGSGLSPGRVGKVTQYSGAGDGSVVSVAYNVIPHKPHRVFTGEVFSTTPVNLGPGTYTVSVALMGNDTGANAVAHLNRTAVVINVHATAYLVEGIDLNVTWFSPFRWTVLTFNVTISAPVLNLQVRGTNEQDWMFFRVQYVTLAPVAGP
jgi:uncharacterized membrane protein